MFVIINQQWVFFAFSAVLLSSALFTIFARNTVHSVLSLVLVFLAAAGIWILLSAEFLALLLILVYVGAVMTLFLFVVMTINLRTPNPTSRFSPVPIFASLSVVVMIGLVTSILFLQFNSKFLSPPPPSSFDNTRAIGRLLYEDYIYPFEIAGVLLLVAIVAAISLSRSPPRGRKIISVKDQVKVEAKDRITLVKMDSTKKS